MLGFRKRDLVAVVATPPPKVALPQGVTLEEGFQVIYAYRGFGIALDEDGKTLSILSDLFEPGHSFKTLPDAIKQIDLISPWRDPVIPEEDSHDPDL